MTYWVLGVPKHVYNAWRKQSLTSTDATLHPFSCAQSPADDPAGNTRLSAQAEQVRAVAVERVGPVLGRVPEALMLALDDALRVHLQL